MLFSNRAVASFCLFQIYAASLWTIEADAAPAGCAQERCVAVQAIGAVQDTAAATNYVPLNLQNACMLCMEAPRTLNSAEETSISAGLDSADDQVYLRNNLRCGGEFQARHDAGGKPLQYRIYPAQYFFSDARYDICRLSNTNCETDTRYGCAAGVPQFVNDACCYSDDPCFSAVATVETRDKGQVTMQDLEVGDHVLTTSGFSKVYTIDHRNEEQPTEFLQLYTGLDHPLELTPEHLIYLYGKHDPVQAGSVVVGDEVQSFADGEFQPATVTNISSITRKGVYNPITSTGTLIVDGLSTSTYTAISITEGKNYVTVGGYKIISLHDFFHLAMSPIRSICMYSPKSISDNLCLIADGEERSMYDNFGLQVIEIVKSQNDVFQGIFVLSSVAFFVLLNILTNPVVVLGFVSVTLVAFQSKKKFI